MRAPSRHRRSGTRLLAAQAAAQAVPLVCKKRLTSPECSRRSPTKAPRRRRSTSLGAEAADILHRSLLDVHDEQYRATVVREGGGWGKGGRGRRDKGTSPPVPRRCSLLRARFNDADVPLSSCRPMTSG